MVRFRRWTILIHRYLGIVLSGLFAMWFLSGIAMIYAGGMPTLTADERLRRMPPLDFGRVRVSALDAAVLVGRSRSPGPVRMLSIVGRPAYRFGETSPVTVFADNGERLREVGVNESLDIAARFMTLPAGSVHYVSEQGADQWTIGQRAVAPFHKIRVNDRPHTELYVSAPLGEVVVMTTRAGRSLAWFAAIPHWLYFAPFRLHARAWAAVVLWVSGLGVVAAGAGLLLGVFQYRVRYSGLMRWHYLLGVTFGAFALTWVFSGFLSMQPANWASARNATTRIEETLSGGPLDLSQFPRLSDADSRTAPFLRGISELELLRIQGRPHYRARGTGGARVLEADPLALRSAAFPIDSITQRLSDGYPDARIRESQLLHQYDSYYYDRTGRAPLPVLRARFEDPQQTWIYVDPATSQVVAEVSTRQRLERWLYHGLHSLDFPFFYNHWWLWAATVSALCACGFVLSVVGVVIGVRRLRVSLS